MRRRKSFECFEFLLFVLTEYSPKRRQFYYRCYEALFQIKSEEEIELLFGEFERAGYTEEKESTAP